MKKKNFNTRTCILTNKKFYKDEMIRIYKVNDSFAIGSSVKGHGYYFNPTTKIPVPQILIKLNRRLNLSISEDELNQILKSWEVNYGKKS